MLPLDSQGNEIAFDDRVKIVEGRDKGRIFRVIQVEETGENRDNVQVRTLSGKLWLYPGRLLVVDDV